MRYHISNGVKNDFSPFSPSVTLDAFQFALTVEGSGGFFCLGKVAWACSGPLHTCRYNETTYRGGKGGGNEIAQTSVTP